MQKAPASDTKNIRLSLGAFYQLKAIKKPNESYSDTIMRVCDDANLHALSANSRVQPAGARADEKKGSLLDLAVQTRSFLSGFGINPQTVIDLFAEHEKTERAKAKRLSKKPLNVTKTVTTAMWVIGGIIILWLFLPLVSRLVEVFI